MFSKRDCRKITAQLWAYAAQRLSEGEQEAVARHLATCAACRREAEAFRTTIGLLTELRTAPLPASQTNWQTLQAELTRLDAKPVRANRPAWVRPALAVGVAICALFYLTPRPPSLGVRPSPGKGGTEGSTVSLRVAMTPIPAERKTIVTPVLPAPTPTEMQGQKEAHGSENKITARTHPSRHFYALAYTENPTHKHLLHYGRRGGAGSIVLAQNQSHPPAPLFSDASEANIQPASEPYKSSTSPFPVSAANESGKGAGGLGPNVDGDNVVLSILPTNYVLPEVQTAESQPAPCHYVMGQIAPEPEPESEPPTTKTSKELQPW